MTPQAVLPPISTLQSLSAPDRAAVLGLLFEPSPSLSTLIDPLLDSEVQPSYPALISTVQTLLQALVSSKTPSDRELLDSILSSHPRLGEKKRETLSAQSAAEQATLGTETETHKLRELNAAYETRFGVRYVVFVNARPREDVMLDMERRIRKGTGEGERRAAVDVSLICAHQSIG